MSNRYCEFIKAISKHDIDEVKHFLATGKCAVNGDNTLKLRDPPIIECIRARCPQRHRVVDSKKCEILKLLVQDGADVNIQTRMPYKETASMVAAEFGYSKCLQFLVESGANLNLTCYPKETALNLAVKEGQIECVKYLVRHMPMAMLNHKNHDAQTALIISVSGQNRLPVASRLCVKYLLAAGVDLDVKDLEGDTALLLALKQGFAEAVSELLKKGALVNILNDYGHTPLYMARHSPKFILKLLYHGLNPTSFRRDRDCVHYAVSQGQTDVIRGLVKNGFPPLDLGRFKKRGIYVKYHIIHQLPPISPLAVAILATRPSVARYLIVNRFFTRYDILQLCWERRIRGRLLDRLSNDERPDRLETRQCLKILDFLSSRPRSLQVLCLTAISSTLSKDFGLDIHDHDNGWPTIVQKDTQICSPTFIEKVDLLELPQPLKRALLHQTPSSNIRSDCWGDILLRDE